MDSNLVLILIFVGALMIFFPTVFYIVVGKSKNKRFNRLKKSGEVINATITKIQNEAVKDRPVIVCRIHAESRIDQIKYVFVSEKIYPQDCKELQVGDMVKVLINHLNPKKYYFDYSSNGMDY